MSHTLTTVLESAMSLSDDDRARLAEALWASLESDPSSLLSEAWQAEIKRRSAEYDAGLVQAVPWDEVRAAARSKVE